MNRFNRFLNRAAIVCSVINIVASLILLTTGDGSTRPGMLNSAFGAGLVALWFSLRGRQIKDTQLTLLSIPFVIIFFCSIFNFTSYLFSIAISAALIYLFTTDPLPDAES